MATPILRHILYVDDEEDIRAIVKLALETYSDVTVTLSASGSEGIQEAINSKPDLIILDVMMPKMDGPATLKLLKQNPDTATIPVAFMTAKTQAREISEFLRLGAIDVLRKPFDPTTLHTEILKTWSKHVEEVGNAG